MSETKFTPGPWVVKNDDWGIHVQCKDSVSGLSFAVTPICEVEQEEDTGGIDDAHLIAAAPDMYEALEALLSLRHNQCGCGSADCLCDRALAALKKARGEV